MYQTGLQVHSLDGCEARSPHPHSIRSLRQRLLGDVSGTALLTISVTLALGVSLPQQAHAGSFSGTYTGTYALQPGSNPMTFTGSSYINSSGDGIDDSGGTSWTITNNGTIQARFSGLDLQSTDTLTNAGTIIATGNYGVIFIGGGGGSITNQIGGSISGDDKGVEFLVGPGTVVNAGMINGTNNYGVDLNGGGSVTNQAGGTINGRNHGVVIGHTGVVTNAGTITGSGPVGRGVDLNGGGGSVVNQAGGSISGGSFGIYAANGAGTVTNAGTITGGTAAIKFTGTGANQLTLDTGSVLDGAVIGSNAVGATNALVLQGSGTADSDFQNFQTLAVNADGTWTLNGVSAIGAITVTAGTLAVGDAGHTSAQLTGAFTIAAGASLAGHGTVVGNVTSDGTVAPGGSGSIGTLTITGNFTQGADGTLAIDVTPQGGNSLIAISGTANLAGKLELVTAPGIYRKGTSYKFLTAGAISGGFTTLTADNGVQFIVTDPPASLTATLTGDDTGTMTTGTSGFIGNALTTPNERAVGIGLSNAPLSGDPDTIVNAVNALSPTGQNAALDQLGAEIDADFLTTGRAHVDGFLTGLTDQLAGDAGGGGTRGTTAGGLTVWGHAYGDFSHADGDGNAHRLNATSAGGVIGLQRLLGADTTLGAALSYGHTDLSLSGVAQSGRFETGAAGFYGEQRFGRFFIDGAATLGYDHGDSTRLIDFTGISRRATGSFDGFSAGVLGAAGMRLHGTGGVTFEPSVALAYSHVAQGGFTETGADSADLTVEGESQDVAESRLGARLSQSVALPRGTMLRLTLGAAWAHELTGVTPGIGESFTAIPGSGFRLVGADPGRDAALFDAGFAYDLSPRLSFYGRYHAAIASHADDNAVTAGVTYSW